MSNRILSIDVNGFPIQTLALGDSVTKIVVGASTQRGALPTGVSKEDIVRLASNTDCYIKFGDSTVEATDSDTLFTQGVEAFKIPMNATHIAVLQLNTGGIMTITELK